MRVRARKVVWREAYTEPSQTIKLARRTQHCFRYAGGAGLVRQCALLTSCHATRLTRSMPGRGPCSNVRRLPGQGPAPPSRYCTLG